MFDRIREKKELYKRAKELEKDKNFSLLLSANFEGSLHNMLIGEEIFKEYFLHMPSGVKEECSALEKVELIDYWNNKYGRTNKKR